MYKRLNVGLIISIFLALVVAPTQGASVEMAPTPSRGITGSISSLLSKAPRGSFVAAAVVAGGTASVAACHLINTQYHNSHYWDWSQINPLVYNKKSIEGIFRDHRIDMAQQGHEWLWGVGTSAHQVEGNSINNDWYEWAALPQQKANGVVEAGLTADHWHRYKEDIALFKKIGINAYRFEVAFDKVMPQPGVIDKAALAHYKDVCIELVKAGIKPVVTLFHQPRPTWFAHLARTVIIDDTHFSHLKNLLKPGETTLQLQSWEDPENIKYFVQFAQAVFDALHEYVYLWLTFNRPEGYAAAAWFAGLIPPAKKSLPLMAEVLKNLLEAHVQVYRALKARPGGATSKIGITKNAFYLKPWMACNPLDHLAASIGNELQNECIYRFFNTGVFSLKLPFGVAPLMIDMHYTNDYVANGGQCNDFIGINCYGGGYMNMFKVVHDTDREVPTSNPNYTIDAESFYRGVLDIYRKLAQPHDLPIYITENGIGTNSDDDRTLFTYRYLYTEARLIEEGVPLYGIFWWSGLDNYEWGSYKKRYGLYHVDFDTQKRTLKEGARQIIKFMYATQGVLMPELEFVSSKNLAQ